MEAAHLYLRFGPIWILAASEPLLPKTKGLRDPRSDRFHISFMPVKLLTLSCVSSILPIKHQTALQRRRAYVQDQLCLWPEAKSPRQEPSIWEGLSPETQRRVIAVLSKLISRAACPPPQEENNERW